VVPYLSRRKWVATKSLECQIHRQCGSAIHPGRMGLGASVSRPIPSCPCTMAFYGWDMKTIRFLDAARQGKNDWWRYLLGILIILILWFAGMILVLLLASILLILSTKVLDPQQLTTDLEKLIQSPTLPAFVINHVPYLFVWGAIFLIVRGLHQRRLRTLISGDGSIRWKRLMLAFGVWWLLLSLETGIDYWLDPGNYLFNFNPGQWGFLLPIAVLLTPLQTSMEELLFRGYLLQGLGLLIRNPLVLIGLINLPFAIAHFTNPEMARGAVWMGLLYFSVGAFLTAITLKDNRLELALGVHAANNLFIALIASSKDSALPSPALLIQTTPDEPARSLLVFLIMATLFYGLFFYRRLKPTS